MAAERAEAKARAAAHKGRVELIEHDPLPVVWRDDTMDRFDPRSVYVETYWLAVLGPSAILAVRRLSDWLQDHPSGIEVGVGDLAASLGLGHGSGRQAPIIPALERLVLFGIARVQWDTYAVRRTIAPLAPRQHNCLPGYLAVRHDADAQCVQHDQATTIGLTR